MKKIIHSIGKILPIIIAAFTIYSCINATSTEADITVLLGENTGKVYLYDMIDSVSLTALNEDSSSVVGDAKKVEETDSFYFILNQQKNMLAKFDKNGEFRSSFCKLGHAKGEYITINDFSVDELHGNIFLLADNTKLFVLDFSFKVKDMSELKTPLERICAFGTFVYGYSALHNKIVAVSANGCSDIVQGVELPSWVYSQTQVFFKTDGKLLASLECDNCIYSLSSNRTDKFISYSYDGYDEMLKRYSDKEDTSENIFQNTPIRIRSVSVEKDTLRLIYSKDMIVRCACIDLAQKCIVADGIFFGSPSPEWNGHKKGWIAESFANGTELPVDSVYRDKITYLNSKSLSGLVIVKYY